MTPDQAFELVAQLVFKTNGWDDAAVAKWAADLGHLDATSAALAIDHVCATWDSPARPTWATFHKAYTDLRRSSALARQHQALNPGPVDRSGVRGVIEACKILAEGTREITPANDSHTKGHRDCPRCREREREARERIDRARHLRVVE